MRIEITIYSDEVKVLMKDESGRVVREEQYHPNKLEVCIDNDDGSSVYVSVTKLVSIYKEKVVEMTEAAGLPYRHTEKP